MILTTVCSSDVAAIQFINYWVVLLWQSNVFVLYTFPFVLLSCALVSWVYSWSVVILCNAFYIFHWWFCVFSTFLFPNSTPWRIAINCCLKERSVFCIAMNLLTILSFHHHFLFTFRAVSLLAYRILSHIIATFTHSDLADAFRHIHYISFGTSIPSLLLHVFRVVS